MALIDITPIMSSNTEPSPYIVTASSYQATYEAYKALISDAAENAYATAVKTPVCFVQLDFGSTQQVDAFTIQSRTISTEQAPKIFTLYGSDDGILYESLHSELNEVNWVGDKRLYKLNKTAHYRYYKISVAANNGGNETCFRGVSFLKEDNDNKVKQTRANLRISAPHASKARLKNTKSDIKYMLVLADDDNSLYNSDKDGNYIMTKAANNVELLWSGLSKTEGNYPLIEGKNWQDYSKITIVATLYSPTNRNAVYSEAIVDDLIKTNSGLNDIVLATSPTQYVGVNFKDTNGTSFNICNCGTTTLTAGGISAIYGTY